MRYNILGFEILLVDLLEKGLHRFHVTIRQPDGNFLNKELHFVTRSPLPTEQEVETWVLNNVPEVRGSFLAAQPAKGRAARSLDADDTQPRRSKGWTPSVSQAA